MTRKMETNSKLYGQGIRINSNQDMMLARGSLITPLCYKDIYYHKNKGLANLDMEKVVYYMNKTSAVFDYIDHFENLKLVLDLFDKEPLYYYGC